MKKIYLLFVTATLAACSAEPLENEGLSGLDTNLEGKSNNKVAVQVAEDPMGFYAGNSGNLKGTLAIWNDCDNLYLEITSTDEAPETVEISFLTDLPELNPGGNFSGLTIDYSLNDADNLVWTVPVSAFDIESDLLIFVKAWGDYAGASTFGERNHQHIDYIFDFSMCGDCEESFIYVDNGDNTYTFTYVPKEDADDAELVFTFAQGVDVAGLSGWEGNGQTRKMAIDLEACTTYEWIVELEAKCSGNSGNSNVWTDFKVDNISKKANEEDKFVQPCN